MCKYNAEILLSAPLSTRIARSFDALSSLILSLSTTPSLTTSRPLSARSVVSRGLSLVANQLESANHLTDCEETQQLGSNNRAGGQLCRVDISELLHDVAGVWGLV